MEALKSLLLNVSQLGKEQTSRFSVVLGIIQIWNPQNGRASITVFGVVYELTVQNSSVTITENGSPLPESKTEQKLIELNRVVEAHRNCAKCGHLWKDHDGEQHGCFCCYDTTRAELRAGYPFNEEDDL